MFQAHGHVALRLLCAMFGRCTLRNQSANLKHLLSNMPSPIILLMKPTFLSSAVRLSAPQIAGCEQCSRVGSFLKICGTPRQHGMSLDVLDEASALAHWQQCCECAYVLALLLVFIKLRPRGSTRFNLRIGSTCHVESQEDRCSLHRVQAARPASSAALLPGPRRQPGV